MHKQFGDLIPPFYAAPSSVEVRSNYVYEINKFAPYMMYLGRVTRFTPYKTKYTINPYFEQWVSLNDIKFNIDYIMTPLNSPALEKSILKYNRPQPVPELKQWNVALDWTERHFRRWLSSSRVESEEKILQEFDKSKSAGFPWNLSFKNKKAFLAVPANIEYLRKYWNSLHTADPFDSFWVASLKKEMRDIDKVRLNKIRSFTASSVEHVYATNRLCWDMNNKFYSTANKHWSFVGATKFYAGWDNLYKRLNRLPNAFELDESSFDASLFRDAMMGQLYLRKKFTNMTADEARKLDEVYRQIVDSNLVMDNGQVFTKETGNPSGSANTIVDNTMILFRLFAYAWIMLSQKHCPELCSYDAFMTHVEAALNGDDNTYTCSDAVVGWFNPTAIAEVWSQIGVETTTPDEKPRKLQDVMFLSMRFQWYDKLQMWLPRPDRARVMCSLREGSENLDIRWLMLRAMALRIESWPDEETRKDIQGLIQWIEQHYSSYLQGVVLRSPEGPQYDITYDMIDRGYKTDSELERLYCSRVSQYQSLPLVYSLLDHYSSVTMCNRDASDEKDSSDI